MLMLISAFQINRAYVYVYYIYSRDERLWQRGGPWLLKFDFFKSLIAEPRWEPGRSLGVEGGVVSELYNIYHIFIVKILRILLEIFL